MPALPDVTLTASAAPLSATSIRAAWVQIQAKTVAGTVRLGIGSAAISATEGGILSGSQFFPTQGNSHPYDLSQIYGLSSTPGDTVAVMYG